jgi:hypothetical protein
MNSSTSSRALPRTQAFTRSFVLRALNDGTQHSEAEVLAQVQRRWPDANHARILAANEVGGMPYEATTSPGKQFLSAVREATVLGQLALFELPFRTSVPALVTSAEAEIVGPGKAIRVSSAGVENVNLVGRKAATIVVTSKELLRAGTLAERGLQQTLTLAATKAIDSEFFADGIGAVAAVATGASDAATAAEQIDALIAALLSGVDSAENCAVVAHPKTIALLASLREFGDGFFPEVKQGRIRTLPLLPSAGIATDVIAAVDGARLATAFGTAEIVNSGAATLELSAAPTGDAGVDDGTPSGATQAHVSLFQNDLVALKVVAEFDFQRIGSGGFQYLSGFNPSATTSA